MKLYTHPLSGNGHRVGALLNLLNIEHEIEIVNLPGGAQKAPEYLTLNPMGQVPVLVDGDVTLRDSSAILIYIAMKYDTARTWLPDDAAKAAYIQQWLSNSVNEIISGPFTLRVIKLLGSKADYDAAKAKTERLFGDLFEPHLAKNDWLVGDGPTLADVANYSYIAVTHEGEFSLDPYPAIKAWLTRVEAIKGFTPMPAAADIFAAMQQ